MRPEQHAGTVDVERILRAACYLVGAVESFDGRAEHGRLRRPCGTLGRLAAVAARPPVRLVVAAGYG